MSATKIKETVAVEKGEYERLVADAKRWRQLQARVADYRASLAPEKQAAVENPYARWARENMKEKP